MIEIIYLRWINREAVEVTATDNNSELNLGIYGRRELESLAEHFRNLAEELEA